MAKSRPYWGLALAGLLAAGLGACGGSSTITNPPAVVPANLNLLIVSSSTTGHLPDAIAGSPYAYGFQTNIGQTGVVARPPVTFRPTQNLPPGLTLTSSGVLAGTPTAAGTFSVAIEAVDSSSTPHYAQFTYQINVRAPGATLTAVAHNPLGGHGQNAAVAVATATTTHITYAYVGTRGSPGDCPATGVKVVDLSQITNPQLVATVGGVPGAKQREAKVITGVSSPGFHGGSQGDLMAVTEQACDPNNVAGGEAGVEFFDVTDPTHPALLGSWNSGLNGVSDVAFVPVPGPANSLGVVDHSQDKLYALAAVPNSESSGGPEGDLRVLDITDPAAPREVGNWGVLAATATQMPQAVQGSDPRVFLDTIELSSDRKTAYLSYWDEGVVVLDVSDPLAIRSNNANVFLDHIQYPVTSIATSSTPSSPEGNTHEALPVAGGSELLIADQVCASAMAPSPSNPAQNVPLNPSVGVVCGAGSAVPLTNNAGWGFLRTYDLPTPGSATVQGFFTTPQAESDPAPDRGIYTAHDIAWNGNAAHPHAYVAWYSSGVVDLDISSIAPPARLASFVPPDSADPNGTNPAVDNPAKAMVYGVAAYAVNGLPYILATDINSGLWILAETPANQLTILTTSLPDGNVEVPYFATLSAVNGALGSGKIAFSVASNSNPLPSGLNLDPQGNLTGTPLVAGTVLVTFGAHDLVGNSTLQSIYMTIDDKLAVLPPTPPLGTTNEPYTLPLLAVDGTTPYTWSVVRSTLPTGLTLSTTSPAAAQISGTPPSISTTTFTLQVTDSSVPANTATLPVTIQVAKLGVKSAALPVASVGVAYQTTVDMANGQEPYSPVVLNGTLPPGLLVRQDTISTLGWDISGTPTTAGVYNFSVQVTDADGQTLLQPFTLVVNPYEISPAILPAAVEGRGYLETLSALGGTSPYTFNLVLGSLPAGLSMDSFGNINGVPASGTAGIYPISVQATDSTGMRMTQSLALTVFSGNTFAITTTGLPPADVGQMYQLAVTADFGAPPYVFSLAGGSLPAGVTLDPNGTLNGVPGGNSAGNYSFLVQAVDSNGQKATQHFDWTVLPPLSVH
ncbi:MAG TPA: putative Ig domain-containing protein [Terriglobales bacterium]|nr:putative Ig domain-containing protein [Terriglobales bacterium]